MIHVAVKVDSDPDFYPDGLDLDALPPLGTRVYIERLEYLVAGVTLKVEMINVSGGGVDHKSHYEINMRGPY